MKILLLGKNGQLGWELQRSLAPLGELIALDRHSTPLCGDFADLSGLAHTVQTVRPDIIVNAAAYTAVDHAESQPELAHTVNALAPGVLAQEAQRLGAWLVHYSTDYVFNGSGNQPWAEHDTPEPLNVYGRSKWAGERAVAAGCEKHLIFRTSWVYAARGNNFAKTMLRLAQERARLEIVSDQWGAPTGAELIADVTAHAIGQVRGQPQQAGTYHLVAGGETTWYDYAKHVIAQLLSGRLATKIIVKDVLPILSQDFPTPAPRPLNSRLDTHKLKSTFALHLPPWQHGVDRMLAEWAR